jgi:tubulin polyglutamylase TTLL6/13
LSRSLNDFDPQDHAVVQRYTHKIFLIDKLKFDLRIYVLLCGVDPLRIYFFKEGLCRLATCEYKSPTEGNIDNLFMHLTNYAINKASKDFVQNKEEEGVETGHKRSLTFALEYIREMGHDADKLLHDIKANIIKTIVAV